MEEKEKSLSKPRTPEATRRRILVAARQEFARKGLAGARVDVIARRAKANKQMLYHYFGGKEDLYLAVLEAAYGDIRAAEAALELEHLDPVAALRRLVEFTWDYYVKNPDFLALVNHENLGKARHFRKSERLAEIHGVFRGRLAEILRRGVRRGIFRKGIDADQLNLTIAAIGYYYLTNRYTNSIIFGIDLGAPAALGKRLDFNLQTILRLVLKTPEQ
ncbi:MAG: TetR family transcriptional regulator [Acidobacteriota bacterium]